MITPAARPCPVCRVPLAGYHGGCDACNIEAVIGTEDHPHPVTRDLHTCVPPDTTVVGRFFAHETRQYKVDGERHAEGTFKMRIHGEGADLAELFFEERQCDLGFDLTATQVRDIIAVLRRSRE